METVSNYTQAAYATLRDNGGTFTSEGDTVQHVLGYMVGGFAPTRTISLRPEDYPAAWPARDITMVARRLREYVGDNAAVFCAPGTTTRLGTWVDGGILYIDAVRHYADKLTAVAHGLAHGELAVWDCAAGAAVSLAPYRAALQGVAG